MTARTALIGASIGPSELLDDRVCECCPTDAAATGGGAWFVYRDRGADETREIFGVAGSAQGWSQPRPVSVDAWRIPGCPVNGPAADVRDERGAVAWFTGADAAPRVVVGFGREPAAKAVVVDSLRPLGRVGLALDADGSAVVSWLAVAGEQAELRLRRAVASGTLGEPLVLGRTSAARSSGIPQLEEGAGSFYVAWVEELGEAPSRIRVREIAAQDVPPAARAAPPG
jgi:hypothetical protein